MKNITTAFAYNRYLDFTSKFWKLKHFYSDIHSSEFLKNASTLITGSVIAQIIPILLSPIISRLYFPEDYALYAAYNSIAVLVTVAATGMYSSAVMIDKNDEEAFNTAIAAISITISITILTFIILILFSNSITALTGNKNISNWLYFIPLTVLFTGWYQTITMWNNRQKRFKRLAGNRVIQTFITSGSLLLLGLLSYHKTGLIISMLIGQGIAFILLFIQTTKLDNNFYKTITLSAVKKALTRHKDFPKYNMPQGFLDGIRESSIILIISNYFGAVILGSFSFAMNILNKPLQLISNSFSQVLYQKANEKYLQGAEIWGVIKKTSLLLVIISLPFFVIFIIWGKQIFEFVYGSKWGQAGLFSQILSIWLLFRFIISALSGIPVILKEQKKFFHISLVSNILPIAVLLIASMTLTTFDDVLYLFAGVNLLIIFFMFYWIRSIAKTYILLT